MEVMRLYIPPFICTILCLMCSLYICGMVTKIEPMSQTEQLQLRNKTMEMFMHAYTSYMTYAYPADELMPIACVGRVRGKTPSRGDLDDALGNFSLTLIDSLDTLALLGLYEEFEDALKKVQDDVTLDSDLVVSVFETNIRVLGGLLGGHSTALELQRKRGLLKWYDGSLLRMAVDLGDRLLPAFNTSSGIPFSRINLSNSSSHKPRNRDTCTACAGTMLLEMAALSRFTGNPIYEEKAKLSMDYLWSRRQRSSDLMGTVISVDNGEWIRKESGVGAGIDSYYEYLLKAYILLGDETYLNRFNIHYQAIQQYIAQGPLMLDVLMHKPTQQAKHFIDALSAFWPGLQVLKGDINSAVETHELLYQVFNKHKFLPEAFTTSFDVYWGQYPLRPEFAESTYHLYKATKDPYYLEVGKTIVENLQSHARVSCGFAGIKDIRTFKHEDRMDSYFLAEMFKYLFLLFTPEDTAVGVDIEDYIFTTEAHLLPLKLGMMGDSQEKRPIEEVTSEEVNRDCPKLETNEELHRKFADIRATVNIGDVTVQQTPTLKSVAPLTSSLHISQSRIDLSTSKIIERLKGSRRLVAREFQPDNQRHIEILQHMGISMTQMKDGRLQLFQNQDNAAKYEDAVEGVLFMQEMAKLTEERKSLISTSGYIHVLSSPYLGNLVFAASLAQFGMDLGKNGPLKGTLVVADPKNGCSDLKNTEIKGKIVITRRGDCMFVEKAKLVEDRGGVGMIVVDNIFNTSYKTSDAFAMAGDGKTKVEIASMFVFWREGEELIDLMKSAQDQILSVSLSTSPTFDAKLLHEFQKEADKDEL